MANIDFRERERRSHDKIRVNNPFDKDYPVVWDGFHHVVRARSYAILDRYLADKWLREQGQRLVIEEADKAVKDENDRRVAKGLAKMDPTQHTNEQLGYEERFYAGWTEKNGPVVRKIKEHALYGGVVEEFGLQYVPQATRNPSNDLNESLTEDLDSIQKAIDDSPIRETQVQSIPLEESLVDMLEGKSQPELRKLAKEKGITTQNTDKKADLIKILSA